jgi:nicotinate (nicotinamide) nucleotide adenylyltransferase
MSAGIYGGAFNPICKHHVNIISYILKQNIVDKVVIVPAYKSQSNKQLETGYHRLMMCNLVLNNNNKVIISDYEIKNKLTDDYVTIVKNLMNHLTETYKFNKYYFIIGSDNAININNWKDKDEVLKLLPYIIIPRPFYDLQDKWHGSHIYLKDYTLTTASSTLARKCLNDTNNNYLHDSVIKYIKDNHLFKWIQKM